jgi:hypothetical protein
MKAYLFYLTLSVFISTKVIGFFLHQIEVAQAQELRQLERALRAGE